MLDIPLLITRPEVKEVAESVSKRTGQEVSPAHVMYDYYPPSPQSAKFGTNYIKPRMVPSWRPQCHS